ncbi:Holo-[acyl-carrier-protein] synthase [Buchnera aphidicola (Cinara cuneomaculata)]|uniref:Holo-[acyl-carrier-protein] synthase n=1 Tax=Buchnera aphidicola (Cinara cuneomaculata) TaxID=1660040 RepID=A0A451CXQ3_9GAMM|nr:holo-ACP synthase [Buchnera aphidicola]VFP78156.1 Holo-[acyl-carrier-protein] synthase [Buchnera aphidicola (Cinara cuneomaculata)]
MSIIGIGIDMVSILRFKKLIINYGIAIPNKILSKTELDEYTNIYHKEKFLAQIFTAKEATAKAMGLGIYNNMFLKNCEIVHNRTGKPHIKMFGYVKNKLHQLKVKKIFLSITDTSEYTQSIVILEN